MNIYQQLISALWIVFIAYWALAAIGAKRSIGARGWRRGIGLRLAVIVVIALILRHPAVRSALRNARTDVFGSAFMGMIGLVLCALGIALAIWARAYLGRNWGMPMSRKEHPELVTNGPYAFVRHPIYTGILLALLGTTIGVSVFWAVPLVLAAGYFIYSARQEEEALLTQFPEQYPAYMKRSNMLLPWPFGSAGTTDRN
jgi:protein-S-isoprenylcysteine O-methyltransferase Ste14